MSKVKSSAAARHHPLITRDPVSGGPLIVTRLESPETGVVIEGAFSLGWIGRLTPAQLAFVGLLVQNRGNVQKVAADLNVAYNTARSRLDDVVAALEAPTPVGERRGDVLQRLSAGEIEVDEALRLLDGTVGR